MAHRTAGAAPPYQPRLARPAADGRVSHIWGMVRHAARDYTVVIAVGLLLTHIWRWHDFHPLFVALRLGALFTVASWILLVVKPRTGAIFAAVKRPYGTLLLLWTAWMLIGVPAAVNPDIAWSFWFDFHSKNVLLFLFLVSTLATLRSVHALILANILGMTAGIYFYIKSGMPQTWTPYSMYDRNDLALLFNMTIPVAVWAAFAMRERWAQALAWGVVLAGVASVVGTGSRGGLLALAAVSVLVLLRFKLPMRVKGAFVLGLTVLLVTAPESYWDRMSTILDPSDDYNFTEEEGRIEVWKRAMGYTASFPVFGVGTNNFAIAWQTLTPDGRRRGAPLRRGVVTHNSFLQTSSENGVPGFIFYLGMLLTALWSLHRTGRKLQRTRDPEHARVSQLCDLLALCLVAYCVGGFFLSQAYFSYLIALMAIVAGVEYVSERMLAQWRHSARPRPQQRPAMAAR